MAIAAVGTPTVTQPAAAVTTVTTNVPAGVANGNLLVWHLSGAILAVPSTPAGWTLLKSGTTTAMTNVSFYRIASSEPASYNATVSSGRWCAMMRAFSGVNTTTPLDVAVPNGTAGTTATAFPAITPVTAGAWVLGLGTATVGAGITNTTASSTNLDQISSTTALTTAANSVLGFGYEVWASGAFTPAMAFSNTTTRSFGITAALRPAAGGATAPRPSNITVTNTAALIRAHRW